MGIPKYFRSTTQKYPQTIRRDKPGMADSLFVDFNCAVHPCCRQLAGLSYSHDRKNAIEKQMISECIDYLVKLILFANPKRLVYIAIDGVAPRAKMTQQRSRRYKSIQDKKLDQLLKEQTNYIEQNVAEHLKDKQDELWDTNSITPGTIFMKKLSDKIVQYFKTTDNPYLKSLKIIFSDSNQPGEGEHKILSYIRKNSKDIEKDHNVIIYGLDADLIMLAIVSHINRIYLLRESIEFGKELNIEGVQFCYLDIDLLKISLMEDIADKIPQTLSITDKLKVIDDYVFLCFTVGNDFLPHLPGITIGNGGIGLLTDMYAQVFNNLTTRHKKYGWKKDDTVFSGDLGGTGMEKGWKQDKSNYEEIVNFEFLIIVDSKKCLINFKFLAKILEKIGRMEHKIMLNQEFKRGRFKPRSEVFKNEYERRKKLLENYPILDEKTFIDNFGKDFPLDPKHKEKELNIDVKNEDKNWRNRYYKSAFLFEPTRENKDHACFKYVQGLVWVLTYYYKGCTSWNWYYPWHNAPIISDVHSFITNPSKWKSLKLDHGSPYKPFEQLMIVLPPESSHLLPKSYQKLVHRGSPIEQYYPEDVQFDTIYRRLFWECPPILPPINDKHLSKTLNSYTLTDDEKDRNQIKNLYVFEPSEK